MKKKLVLLLAAVMAVSVVFTGCGSRSDEISNSSSEEITLDNEPRNYKAKDMLKSTDYDVEDYVTLGDYKKISVEIDKSYEVTDANIKAQANDLLSQYPDYVETKDAAKENDKVNIDYVGKVDDSEFEGGSGKDYDLVLGSGTFIDGFEDGLIGHKAGEKVTLNLTFPEDYSGTQVAGKDAVFEVTINKVSTPKDMDYDHLTDEYVTANFAQEFGLNTVDDFKQRMNDSMENQKDVQVQSAFLQKLVEESEIKFPEGLLDERVQQVMDSYEESCKQYGMELEDYIKNMYGQSVDEFKADQEEQLTESLKEELVLEALVKKLNCKLPSDEFIKFVQYYAQQYNMSESEFIKQCGGKDYLILNYAEYYKALPEAAKDVKVSYVDTSAQSDKDSSADADNGDTGSADKDQ